MSRQKAYINGSCCISTQATFNKDAIDLGKVFNEVRVICVEPDYSKLPAGMIGRRMNKLTKIGVASAYYALQEANLKDPDAILTATGLGCMSETEKFLLSILDTNEGLVNPTAFMQSTHNTLGGQIALMLQCKNYNFTYVHRGFAFESAVLDGIMQLEEGGKNVLVGGFDEITEKHFYITGRKDHWRKEALTSTDLYKTNASGTIAGEGSVFFVLGNQPNEIAVSSIDDMDMIYEPENSTEIMGRVLTFLERNGLKMEDVDLFISGRNGDNNFDHYYQDVEKAFSDQTVGLFKHLSGEFDTASAFAIWLADECIRQKKVFSEMMPVGKSGIVPKTVLIYNQFRDTDHALYLIRNCRSTE